jgi:hypothetical protein
LVEDGPKKALDKYINAVIVIFVFFDKTLSENTNACKSVTIGLKKQLLSITKVNQQKMAAFSKTANLKKLTEKQNRRATNH